MGKDSMDLNLGNIWRSWFAFRKGKRATRELHEFQFYLEENLFGLQRDLENRTYRHGPYRRFVVCDNKRREISVAGIRDRVVHRLTYDYLVPIFDKAFVFDAWSCRREKGLLGAIERAQRFLGKCPQAFVWRADIKKFLDSVDHLFLMQAIFRKVRCPVASHLIREVVASFPQRERELIEVCRSATSPARFSPTSI